MVPEKSKGKSGSKKGIAEKSSVSNSVLSGEPAEKAAAAADASTRVSHDTLSPSPDITAYLNYQYLNLSNSRTTPEAGTVPVPPKVVRRRNTTAQPRMTLPPSTAPQQSSTRRAATSRPRQSRPRSSTQSRSSGPSRPQVVASSGRHLPAQRPPAPSTANRRTPSTSSRTRVQGSSFGSAQTGRA